MAHASELLNDTVFEDENIVELECRIVMSISVQSYNGQSYFFSENSNFVLFFFSCRWRGLRFGRFLTRALGGSDS